MSATADMREQIAQALEQVPGITGSALPPRTPTRGQGWPEWQRAEPLALIGNQYTWQVHVALSSGSDEATILEADDLIDRLWNELAYLGDVISVEPTTIVIQTGAAQFLPALTFTLRMDA